MRREHHNTNILVRPSPRDLIFQNLCELDGLFLIECATARERRRAGEEFCTPSCQGLASNKVSNYQNCRPCTAADTHLYYRLVRFWTSRGLVIASSLQDESRKASENIFVRAQREMEEEVEERQRQRQRGKLSGWDAHESTLLSTLM
jgi:hypothetical protein